MDGLKILNDVNQNILGLLSVSVKKTVMTMTVFSRAALRGRTTHPRDQITSLLRNVRLHHLSADAAIHESRLTAKSAPARAARVLFNSPVKFTKRRGTQ